MVKDRSKIFLVVWAQLYSIVAFSAPVVLTDLAHLDPSQSSGTNGSFMHGNRMFVTINGDLRIIDLSLPPEQQRAETVIPFMTGIGYLGRASGYSIFRARFEPNQEGFGNFVPKRGIWRTDGTAEGTTWLAEDKVSIFEYEGRVSGIEFRDKVIYHGNSFFEGAEPWITDGTSEGTFELKRIRQGSYGSLNNFNPSLLPQFFEYQGEVYFGAYPTRRDGFKSAELWKTDGTSDGTVRVAALFDILSSEMLSGFNEVGGLLYFTVGKELWMTDGTGEGTKRFVYSFSPITSERSSADMALAGDKLIFYNPSRDYVYSSDGTRDGTEILFESENFVAVESIGDSAFVFVNEFSTSDGNRTIAWNTDGTVAGTEVVWRSTAQSFVTDLYPRDGILYYTAGENTHVPSPGKSLWRSDGTAVGTTQMGDYNSIEFFMGGNDNWIPMRLDNGSLGFEPATLNAMDEQITVFDESRHPNSIIQLVTPIGADLYFGAYDQVNGYEPRRFLRATGQTALLSDVSPSFAQTRLYYFYADLNRVYFPTKSYWIEGNQIKSVNSIYSLDSPTGSISVLPEINISHFTPINPLYSFGEQVFYTTQSTSSTTVGQDVSYSHSVRLFRPDPDGNQEVVFHRSRSRTSSTPLQVIAAEFDSSFYFLYSRGAGTTPDAGLYVSDGTVEGTSMVFPHQAGYEFVAGQNHLFFNGGRSTEGAEELYVSDGTASGTYFIDIWLGEEHSSPRDLTIFRDGVLFLAASDGVGREPWFSDGTPAGTMLLADVMPGGDSPEISEFMVEGSVGFFSHNHPIRGLEMWRTDGTPEGTQFLFDFEPGLGILEPEEITPIGDSGYFVFVATRMDVGREVFLIAPGFPLGAAPLVDLEPGLNFSNPENLVFSLSDLVFSAFTRETGRELWRIPFSDILARSAEIRADFGEGLLVR